MNKKKLNIKEFYKEICKLAPSEYEGDFQQHLANQFDIYRDLLDRLNKKEYRKRWGLWEEKKKSIEDLITAIKEAVSYYYEGRYSLAFTRLRDHINEISSDSGSFLDWNVSVGSDFYRMRKFNEGEKPDRNGMFHIPFDMRTKVMTHRFSAPGYPCLYLGASAYVCWEEMPRQKKLNEYYVSRFHSNGIMLLYNLTLPSEDKWNNIEAFPDDLLRFPLVIACMVKVAKPKDPFKPEYIIPQLLMEWFIEERENDQSTNLLNSCYIGFVYTSVHKKNNFESEKSVNYAIPAFLSEKSRYSEELCKQFQLTVPTCCELDREKCSCQANRSNEDMIEIFGQLEARLKDEEKFPLETIEEEKNPTPKIDEKIK